MVIVEPTSATTFLKSTARADDRLYPADGPLDTIMAGLACGVANPAAWDILKHWASGFIASDDVVAARGMRIYAAGLDGDCRITAGESGAVTLGVLSLLMEDPDYGAIREALGLHADSRVLLINTEGMTDPAMYRRILWDGYLPYCSASSRDLG